MENKVYIVLIIFSALVSSKGEENDTNTDVPNDDEEKNLFNGIEELDDKELWDLLKQASRNGSDSDNTVFDYGDYSDLDENQFPDSTSSDALDPAVESTTEQEIASPTTSDLPDETTPIITDSTELTMNDSLSTEAIEDFISSSTSNPPMSTGVPILQSTAIDNTDSSTIARTKDAVTKSTGNIITSTATEASIITIATPESPVSITTTENIVTSTTTDTPTNTTKNIVTTTTTDTPTNTTKNIVTSTTTDTPTNTTENIVTSTTTDTPTNTTKNIITSTTTDTPTNTTKNIVTTTTTDTPTNTTKNIVTSTTTDTPTNKTENIVTTTTIDTPTKNIVTSTTTDTPTNTTKNIITTTTTDTPTKNIVTTTTTDTPTNTTKNIVTSTTTETPITKTKIIVTSTTTETSIPTSESIEIPKVTETPVTTTENIVTSITTDTPTNTTKNIVTTTTTETPTNTTENIVTSTTTETPITKTKIIVTSTTTETPIPTTESIEIPKVTETPVTTTENIVTSITTPTNTTENIVTSTTTETPITKTKIIVTSTTTEASTPTTASIEIPKVTETPVTTTKNIVTSTTTETPTNTTKNIVTSTTTETPITKTKIIVTSTTTETPIPTTESIEIPKVTETPVTTTENIVTSTTTETPTNTTKNIVTSTTTETPITTTKNIVSPTMSKTPITTTEIIVTPSVTKIPKVTTITTPSTSRPTPIATTESIQKSSITSEPKSTTDQVNKITTFTKVPTTTMLPTTKFKPTDSPKTTTTKVQKTTTSKSSVKTTTSKSSVKTTTSKSSVKTTTSKSSVKTTTSKSSVKTQKITSPTSTTELLKSILLSTTTSPTKKTSRVKTMTTPKPSTYSKKIHDQRNVTKKPNATASLSSTTSISNNESEKPTLRPNANKFDPNRISIIDNDNDDITGKPFIESCTGKHCVPPRKNNINIFDSKKLFMIDEATSPSLPLNKTSGLGTTVTEEATTKHSMQNVPETPKVTNNFNARKKYFIPEDGETVDTPKSRVFNSSPDKVTKNNKLDPSRMFTITEESNTVRNNVRSFNPPKVAQIHPVINISLNSNVERRPDTHRVLSAGDRRVNQQVFRGNERSVPELVCFQVRSQEGRMRLSCVHVNSTVRSSARPFLVDIKQRNEFQPQNNVRYRRIFFQDRNRHAIVMNPSAIPRPRASYDLRGGVFRTEDRGPYPPPTFKLAIQVPGSGLRIDQRGMFNPPFTISRTGGHSVWARPLERQGGLRVVIPGRRKRAASSYCNTNGLYEEEGRTLTFVFDNTGSMQSELNQMRETAKEITTQMTGTKSALIKDYVLVLFNDPEVKDPFCTDSYTEFLEALDRISVGGGGDCPEMSLTGLYRALAVSREKSFVFVITDADERDTQMLDHVFEMVMRKGPSIYFLLTDKCGSRISPAYEAIASKSVGGFIFRDIHKSEVKQMLDGINTNLVEDNVAIFTTRKSSAANTPYPVNIPIDKNVKNVTFTVSGDKPHLSVISPDGNNTAGEKKVYPRLIVINVQRPIPGTWVAYAGSSSPHTVSAVGKSEIKLKVGFSVFRTDKISETSHRPLKGGENYIIIEVSSTKAIEKINSIEFSTVAGEHITTIDLEKNTSNNTLYHGGPFIPPEGFFTMKMQGVDEDGTPITRFAPSAISGQLPDRPYLTMLNRITVNAGEHLVVRCHAESLVPVIVKIIKRPATTPLKNYSFKQTGDAYYEVRSATPDNAGTYQCLGTNLAGDQVINVEVTVLVKPPVITVEPQVLFKLGFQVQVNCNISSGVPYTIQWRKGVNKEFVHIEESSRIYRTLNVLIIENPDETDEAWYQCSATNAGGENSAHVYLKMSRMPHIENSPNQSYQKNSKISITCSASGHPPPEIYWLKNGKYILNETGRIILTNSPSYGQIDIMNSVVEDEGTYTCEAFNFAGKVSKETILTYEELPKVIVPERRFDAIVGKDVLLKCQATGVPAPKVHWEKDDASFDQDSVPNHTIFSDNSVFIRSSSLIHNGIYTCIAKNEIGSDEVSISVVITGEPPEITEPPEDTYIEIGENGSLGCRIYGKPEPNVTWRKSGEDNIRAIQIGTSLEFFNVSMADEGQYWCRAENILGHKEAPAHVIVTGGVAPVIDKIKDVEVTKVLVGEKVELPCPIIGGKPYPRIVWYKDGSKLQGPPANGIQLENGSYFISTMNPSDVGLFECAATNELGKDLKKIMLKLYEPPKIEANTNTTVLAIVGNSAKLECIATGDPQPNVTWKRYSHTTYKTMSGIKLEDTSALYFEKVTEDDTGRYICKAENIAGIARRPFALYVLVPPKIGVWPVEMFVEIGNIITLECRVRANPRPKIIWMKDDETIPRSRYYGQFLRFYANSNDSGIYSCTAENRAGVDRVETKLVVLVPPQIAEGPPSIKVISGNEAVLPCQVSGNPQPTTSWQWNGELIKKEFGSDSGTLHLSNVTEADAGTYICTAQNRAGTNKKKTELIVLTPPKILSWTHPFKVVIGEFLNVTCQHFANPKAQITWYKDKVPISSDYIGEKNRLEFIVQPSQEGVYTCEAENEAGKDSKDFLLVILDRPSFALHQPHSYDVLIGNDIEIPCVAFGDPKPIMGWNRTDIIITTSSKRIVNSETGLLTILNASAEDEGYYKCIARNRAGEIWRNVEVNLLEMPAAKLSVSNDIIKEGDKVEFTCSISGKPVPKIHWKKDGKVISTENNKHLRLIAYYKDQGNYTCVVKNSAGEDFSTVHLNVSVLPVIYGHLEEDIVVLEGDSILLNCSSEGIPPPTITWSYNGTLLDTYSVYSEIINNTFFEISEASKEKSGLYACEVKNFAGTARKLFRLNVHVKPFITDNFDTEITLWEGKDFLLPCNAEGVPEPRISWMKNDAVIPKAGGTALSPSTHDNILLIFNAGNSSAGSYTCSADNIEGTTTKNYTITVKAQGVPVKTGMETVEIMEAANGVLNCGAIPGSKIIWFKDNKTLNKMPLERADDVHFLIGDGGNSLKIAEAFATDSGVFSCQASHPDGNTTKLFSVNILVPPYFIDLFPETEFTVKENKSLTLECPIQGNPPPLVNWRLALSNIPVDEYTVPGVHPIGENGKSLLFKSANPSHTGLYLCSGINKMGKEYRTFNVKVIGPPKIIGLEMTQLDIVSGTQLELNCSIDGAPAPTFKWSLLQSSGVETTLKYVSRKIHIGYAQSEDDGLYTCTASNSYGSVTKTFNISVYDAPRIKRETYDKIVMAQGENLNLHCIGEGKKLFVAKWYFNKDEINSTDHMSVKVSSTENEIQYNYKVDNVSKVSQGLYSCLLSNIAGSDQTEFQVEVIAPPKFSKPSINEIVEINIGTPIHIDCPIESENAFRVQWKKNGIFLLGFENRSLDISVSTIEDNGTYTCNGSNIAGWIAYKLELIILDVPKLISSNDTNVTVLIDKSLILNCSVSGNPKPGILWTKNLEQINDESFPHIILLNDNQILKIDDVVSSDVGKYSCFPSNVVGSTEKHFDVTVIEPPSVAETDANVKHKTVEKVVTSDIYKRVVLRCPLTGSPEPEITWYMESEEISEGDKRFRVSYDKKVLIINHAEESVAGIFKCFGMNEFGDTTFIFHLHVRIPMAWSLWSKWSVCNVSCGGGFQHRGRECLGERNDILNGYIHLYNDSCTGPGKEVRLCNEHICPVDGGWGVWSEWGSCSSSCGEGWKRRTRRCNSPAPAYGGSDCSGDTYEDHECESPPCPVNGNWGEWSDWSECSATCGPSIKMRTRRCNNPAPLHGGLPCPDNSRDIRLCNQRKCPRNYDGWSTWSRWTACMPTCGVGRQSRHRTCLLEKHGGTCSGNKRQDRLCKNLKPCSTRYPRHAEMKIHGEINNQQIEELVKADINSDNDTSTISFSKNISPNETFSYLPLVMSQLSWFTAQEDQRGRNGYSLTNGSFHENSTYHFSTGEEMEMMSDVQNEESEDALKLNIKIKGNVPSSSTASIIISPYSEDIIIQKDPNIITSSSTINLDSDGQINPVNVKKTVQFSGNRGSRIYPFETLNAEGSRSYYNRGTHQLEFKASPSVISSKLLRDSCPPGFKYNMDTEECADLNECRRRGLNACLPSQICINTLGSYICECRQGFRVASDTGCRDINECLEGFHQCSHRCVNTRGSYQCLCPKRKILAEDMHHCVDESEDYYYPETDPSDSVDYQLMPSSSAQGAFTSHRRGKGLDPYNLPEDADYAQQDQTEDMLSSDSKFIQDLSCLTGFRSGKDGCEDVNECIEDENSCTKEQLCMNTPGSFVCIEAPCPDHFILSAETRSCILFCLEEEEKCTDGAVLSESLQIITVPVYKGNYTFYPYTDILEITSYDNNDLPLSGSIYKIVQNEAGLPVNIRTEKILGVLFSVKYFEVTKEERLVLMSSKYDREGRKLHSTMFVLLIYNIKSTNI